MNCSSAVIGDLVEPRVDQGGPSCSEFTYVDISSIDNESKRICQPKLLPCETAPSRARQRLKARDVLVSMTRPNLNAVALLPPELDGAIGSTGFDVLRTKPGVEPAWLYYAVQTPDFIQAMSGIVQGALYPAVRPRDIRGFPLRVPLLDEQRRIVAEIEERLSRLEAGVAALKRVQANLKRYRAGALAEITRINHETLPAGWRWSSVGELAQVGTGATPKRGQSTYWQDGTVPWVTSGVVNQPIVTEPTELFTETALQETNCKVYPPGTLLVAMYGEGKTRGMCTELGISAATNQALAAVQTEESLRPYLKRVLQAAYERTRGAASGGVQPNLNLSHVRAIRVPLPPPSVRRQVVE